MFKLTRSWCMSRQSAAAAGWNQSPWKLPSSHTPQCKPGSTCTRCSGRECQRCSQAPSRFWAQLDWHHRSLGKALFTKGALNEKKSLLWTLVRVNAELIAALRQPCPLKISLTLPAGVVLPKEETFEYIERPVRSIHLSGLASKSGRQLLAASCLYQPAQMSGALSTSSLGVLNGQCVYHQSCDINH